MRKTTLGIGIAVLALAAAACTPQVTVEAEQVPAQTAEGGGAAGIAVTGVGEVSGTPDTLTMTFGISVLRDSVSEAVTDSAELTDGLIAALEANGVAEEDIQTADFSIFPEYDFSGEQQRLVGFRVQNSVVAKIRDIDSAGEVIDAAAAAGGDEVVVSGVSFSIEDDAELVEAARAKAWADAEAKAQQLAELSGVTLGEPVAISETISSVPAPLFRAEAVEEMAAVSTPIEPGREQVAVTLDARFAIR